MSRDLIQQGFQAICEEYSLEAPWQLAYGQNTVRVWVVEV